MEWRVDGEESPRLDLRNDKERLARWLVIVVSLPQVEQAARREPGGIYQLRQAGR
jgi:hypothetical protein